MNEARPGDSFRRKLKSQIPGPPCQDLKRLLGVFLWKPCLHHHFIFPRSGLLPLDSISPPPFYANSGHLPTPPSLSPFVGTMPWANRKAQPLPGSILPPSMCHDDYHVGVALALMPVPREGGPWLWYEEGIATPGRTLGKQSFLPPTPPGACYRPSPTFFFVFWRHTDSKCCISLLVSWRPSAFIHTSVKCS